MKPYFIEEIEKSLPLKIERATFEHESFNIGADNWSLTSLSAWRVLSKKGLEFGWKSSELEKELQTLIGKTIIKAKPLGLGDLDPQLTLSDGRVIEIFSSQFLDPWVFHLPNLIIVSNAQSE